MDYDDETIIPRPVGVTAAEYTRQASLCLAEYVKLRATALHQSYLCWAYEDSQEDDMDGPNARWWAAVATNVDRRTFLSLRARGFFRD